MVIFLAILPLINTIDSNVATVNIGRIIRDGNSGIEGEGVMLGLAVGVGKIVGEGLGEDDGVRFGVGDGLGVGFDIVFVSSMVK
jgi:hypothetical protein